MHLIEGTAFKIKSRALQRRRREIYVKGHRGRSEGRFLREGVEVEEGERGGVEEWRRRTLGGE